MFLVPRCSFAGDADTGTPWAVGLEKEMILFVSVYVYGK